MVHASFAISTNNSARGPFPPMTHRRGGSGVCTLYSLRIRVLMGRYKTESPLPNCSITCSVKCVPVNIVGLLKLVYMLTEIGNNDTTKAVQVAWPGCSLDLGDVDDLDLSMVGVLYAVVPCCDLLRLAF